MSPGVSSHLWSGPFSVGRTGQDGALSSPGSGEMTQGPWGRQSLTDRLVLSRLVPGLDEAGRFPGGSAGLRPAATGAEPGPGLEGHHQEGERAAAGACARGLLQSERGHEPDAEHPALSGLVARGDRPVSSHLGKNVNACDHDRQRQTRSNKVK